MEIKLKDHRNTVLLLLQAPLIALILSVIVGNKLNDAKALFIAVIIAIWFGANNAVRDIVAESAIYVRERRFNLKIPSYVFSKFVVLSGIALIQCLLFLAILIGFKRVSPGDFPVLLSLLYLTTLGGISTALFVSALVNSTEKAMSVLPLILIPQLLLSGFFKPVDDLYVNPRTGRAETVQAYRRFEDYNAGLSKGGSEPREVPPEFVQKIEGLGIVRPVSALMLARWSMDGLVHAVSKRDLNARDQLAAQISVHNYALVLERREESVIEDSYLRRVWVDLGIVAGFSMIFLTLTMWALKRKDVL
jgi:hypothetical protein